MPWMRVPRRIRDQDRGGRQEADPNHRRWLRHGARRCHARFRAPRHVEDQECRRSAERCHAGIPRRGAAVYRFSSRSAVGDPRRRRALRGTIIEINGGKIAPSKKPDCPQGRRITVRDLFFNTPARKKFLKAESTELSHIASLVTHYALAHPEKHFELHSATNAMLVAPPVADIANASIRFSARKRWIS